MEIHDGEIMKDKSNRDYLHSTAVRTFVRFLFNLSGWYLGTALTILIVGVFIKSTFFIWNNIGYFLPAILVVPLYYLDRHMQKFK